MKISPRLFTHSPLAVMLFFLFFLSHSCQRNESEPSVPLEKFTLNVTKVNSSAFFYLAKEKGYFEEQSLDVTFQEFQGGNETLKSFLAGESDLATCGEFSFVSQSFSHPELKILAVYSTFKNKEVISKKDSKILTPQDIRGKRIGVTKKSGSEYLLGIFLESHGFKMSDVEIFDLNPENIVEGLLTNNIDLGVTWEPYVFNLKKLLGDNYKSWPVHGETDTYTLLIAKEEWLSNNPDKAERFLKAILKAEKNTKTNPNMIREFLARTFLYEDDYIDSLITNTIFRLELPKLLPGVLTREARWRIEAGLTTETQVPNYVQSIYFAGMDAVKKDAVNIAR